MEQTKKRKLLNETALHTSDFNGNNAQATHEATNGVSKLTKDHIVTVDGRVFYPCQFCNKVFPIKKSRTFHIKKCPAKEYILSVDTPVQQSHTNIPEIDKGPAKIDIKQNIVLDKQMNVTEILSKAKSPPIKLTDIQQNIVLNKKMNVSEILSKPPPIKLTDIKQNIVLDKEILSKSPPIKLTIRRDPNTENSNHFTVSNSIILKEKNEFDDINAIAKRLENNAVTLIKQPRKESPPIKSSSEEDSSSSESTETTCRECTKEFGSPLELLRHARKSHSYPKVLMALSEVKKFYSIKDRSKCPICHKPLKTNFRSAFVKHLHTHTNEMKYSCKVCNKKFRRADHMKAHQKRHVIKNEK